MRNPKVCILRTAGTNCDRETAFAFSRVGGDPELVHIKKFVSGKRCLSEFSILAFPGGFSYGDDVGAGKIMANEIKHKLMEEIKDFIGTGRLIIGICNGFQILVKAGLLPGNEAFAQEASLIINDSGKFEDRWVYLRSQARCVWTKGLPQVIYLPVAHGEGKFIFKDRAVLERLKKKGQIVFKYCDMSGKPGRYPDNPNGSVENIAGICDETGRVLGLMPHPERHSFSWQHPRWTDGHAKREGDGLEIFRNGIEYARKII